MKPLHAILSLIALAAIVGKMLISDDDETHSLPPADTLQGGAGYETPATPEPQETADQAG